MRFVCCATVFLLAVGFDFSVVELCTGIGEWGWRGTSAWLSLALQGARYLGMAFLVCTAFPTTFFFFFFLLENLNCSINGSEGGHADVLSFRQLLL